MSKITDEEMLEWLLSNGYAIVPDRGAQGFADEIFDTREELSEYINKIKE
jgi:hypothetical protein